RVGDRRDARRRAGPEQLPGSLLGPRPLQLSQVAAQVQLQTDQFGARVAGVLQPISQHQPGDVVQRVVEDGRQEAGVQLGRRHFGPRYFSTSLMKASMAGASALFSSSASSV